ncbi:uncharacterized protein LOC102719206 [Oryza brachyantha]|uniref:Uncharacterized protein n=1 Tax=Oryza brachyantha TaxID=4533 RepID=J3M954_ORYBR|nr:uncharacterized protein LOC102719206 [Oryza brachyantha]
MAMEVEEELDEFEVLWPDTDADADDAPPPAISPAPPSEQASMPRAKQQRCAAGSRPVDVPFKTALLHARWKYGGAKEEADDDHGSDVGKVAVVPPHLLLLFGLRRQQEEEEAAPAVSCTPPSLGPRPCKRARDLRHLRNSVLRMTGFIEG